MTYWVFINKDGKIHAGVDKLSNGINDPSELSKKATTPETYSEEAHKLIQYGQSDKECILCCAGRPYLISKETRRRDPNKDVTRILHVILQDINFTLLNNAEELLNEAMRILGSKYVIDQEDNSILIGCGLINNNTKTSNVSIAYYDSRVPVVKSVSKQYLNSELEARDLSPQEPHPDLIIREEMIEQSIKQPEKVGREATQATIAYLEPVELALLLSPAQAGIFSNRQGYPRQQKPQPHRDEGSRTCSIS